MSLVNYILLFAETRDHRMILRDGLEFAPSPVPLLLLPIGHQAAPCVGSASWFAKGEKGLVAEVVFNRHDLGDVPLYPAPDLNSYEGRFDADTQTYLFIRSRIAAVTLVEFDRRPWEDIKPLYIPQAWSGHDAVGGPPDPQRD